MDNPAPNVGDTVRFTITLANGGPDQAMSVAVQESAAGRLAFVAATPSQGSYSSAVHRWFDRRAFTPGAYRATATARDPAGNSSNPSATKFTIVAR